MRQNGAVIAPLIVIAGRVSAEAKNVRGEAFAFGQRYARAIASGGGVPLMLPPIPSLTGERLHDLLQRVDGVLFHGGGDIHPRHYGQDLTADEIYGIHEDHDEVELALMLAAIDLDLPVLGLCRGMQVLNVARGGTLHQHIGSEEHWMRYLPVSLEAGSRLVKAFGTESPQQCHHVHHQAVDQLGAGLRVTGRAADGTVEAIELDEATWVVATQWHPEDNAADDAEQQNVFDELIRQAAAQR